MSRNQSPTDVANQYARDVVEGRIPACRWVQLACQRHLDDLNRSFDFDITPGRNGETGDSEFPWVFDSKAAERAVRFIELLPHVEGEWANKGELIRLEAWQKFIVCSIFGWIHRVTRLRRFREAYIAVPRKNAKSTLAAGIALYMLVLDGEYSAKVFCGATKLKQALYVFTPAKRMVLKTPQLRKKFGVQAFKRSIVKEADGSTFEPLTRDPGDGSSPSCAIVDEYHEHKNDSLYDMLKTGMGARRQPLLLVITTAGVSSAGPCRLLQSERERLLEGLVQDDSRFAIIYTIDEGDDWTDERALIKANPNYGISVMPDYLRNELREAMQSARKQNIFKIKHANVWVGSAVAWLNMHTWKLLGEAALSIEQFLGERVSIGTDLSSTTDITAVVLVFKRLIQELGLDGQPLKDDDGEPVQKAHFYVFGRYYLPEARVLEEENQHYQQWAHDGHLLTTPGPTVDYTVIRRDLEADAERFELNSIAFDPWSAVETQQELQRELGEDKVITIPQKTQFLSFPMKELEKVTLEGRIHHDGNPALAWMLGNVVAKEDANENIFPRKEQRANKIDGAVALIMALSRAIADTGLVFDDYTGF